MNIHGIHYNVKYIIVITVNLLMTLMFHDSWDWHDAHYVYLVTILVQSLLALSPFLKLLAFGGQVSEDWPSLKTKKRAS